MPLLVPSNNLHKMLKCIPMGIHKLQEELQKEQ